MKRRSIVYYLSLAIAVAVLLVWPLGSSAPAQQSTGSSPYLGALVREYEVISMPTASAYSVYTTNTATPHQVWYRVYGGDALFRQRMRVYQENAGPRPMNQLPPESELKEEITNNNATRWFRFGSEADVFTYYFDGDNRLTAGSPWRDAFGVKVKRTRYANGNRYEVAFEDQNSLDDFDDLKLEVVILQSI
ncbi:hypothetical protein VB780_04745 [Leptolyngbya sp. CCNP1308]|uniref:hypothetical protein n=1 Tax=Leptolyngbya sp. CCNP1308 TaxID=3110255 RepID=UPI002B20DFEC|nr:hypothetical protein [Leptolyngbya sp. CCNP1308]MEA5447866.1 hypothetical protein [Leptolyngbya sp. CCNP1308]